MLFRPIRPFFDKDGGGAGGGTPPPADKKPDPTPDSDKDKDKGKAGDDGKVVFETKEAYQTEVDRIVKDRLEREKKKAEKDAEKLKTQAEEKALEEQKKFEDLANTRQKRITELEGENTTLKTEADKVKRYEDALTKYRDVEIAGVPEHLKPLLAKMDVVEQLEYLAANKATLTGKPDPKQPVPPTPPPADKKELGEAEKKKASEETSRNYRNRW